MTRYVISSVLALAGAAAVILLFVIREPGLDVAIPLITGAFLLAHVAWKQPKVGLGLGIAGGLALWLVGINASLGSLGSYDCGSSCQDAAERWSARHDAFFAVGALATIALVLVAIGLGIARLVRRRPVLTSSR